MGMSDGNLLLVAPVAKWLWLLISLLPSIIQSSHCCVKYGFEPWYGAGETSEVILVDMPGVFPRVLSFLSDLLICEISKMV